MVPATLPPILRAARADDDIELLDLLRKAALLGIPSDELNATDSSGRVSHFSHLMRSESDQGRIRTNCRPGHE